MELKAWGDYVNDLWFISVMNPLHGVERLPSAHPLYLPGGPNPLHGVESHHVIEITYPGYEFGIHCMELKGC